MKSEYPKPTWNPNIKVNIDKIIEIMKSYSENKVPFVVFKHGTCVFPTMINEHTDKLCHQILIEKSKVNADFEVLNIDNDINNYLINFGNPIYSVVSESEYISNEIKIKNESVNKGMIPGEYIIKPNDSEKNTRRGYVGLLARARFYLDLEEGIIINRINFPN